MIRKIFTILTIEHNDDGITEVTPWLKAYATREDAKKAVEEALKEAEEAELADDPEADRKRFEVVWNLLRNRGEITYPDGSATTFHITGVEAP